MSGAVPPPAARPLERAARVPQPVCPGCGRCGRVDPAPAPQRAPLRDGVARCGGGGRASPGGGLFRRCEGRLVSGAVPPPAARPLERAARVPQPVCPGCGRCGRVDPAPAPQRAPLRAGVARCGGGGRASPGGVPSTVVRGAWCQALSLPRPPVLWSGQPGFRNPCVPGAVDAGVWTLHRPTACALAGWRCSLWGWRKGVPGGGAFHRCEGRLVSGAVPPPAARPLERAARVPQPVCPGCGRCGRVDPAPAPQRAPLRDGVARCGGGGRASPGGGLFRRCEGRLVSGAVPPPAARPLERAARVPQPVCPGCGRCGRVDPAPAPQRAPLRAGVARCGGGGRASPGGVPSTVVRGAWCQALSLPRPPVLWSGQPGFRNPCVPGAVDAGVWTLHRPTACALAGWRCSLWGWRKGVPGGGAFRRCEGRLVSGAVPPPAARPLEWAARVPVCVCVRVRALLGRVGRAGLPGAFWCASPCPLAALSFCFAWPPPGGGCPPLSRCCCLSSLPWRFVFFFFFFFFPLPLAGWLVSPAWPLAARWWLLPRPPPLVCPAVFVAPAWCLGVVFFFFFFFSSRSSFFVRPRCLRLSLVSGPGCLGPRRLRCLLCWPAASRLSVRLFLFRAFRLAFGCSLVVAAPPPPLLFLTVSVAAARCCVPCCAVRGWVLRCAALLRVVSPGGVLSCAVLRSFGAAACCAVPSGAARRPGALCSAALCFAVFPRAVCSVLCVFCRGAVVRAVVRRSALCCVCPGVLCCAFPVLSALRGAVLRCAGALALCCSCGACRCWRLALWCAAVCCAVSCGVPWCGAGSVGPWLFAGGVFRCRCPCLAAWSASLWLVWFAVVPCFPVSCSVVLCCRVVLCCCSLLSFCGAVGACFALLWAVALCCVVLLVGCAVFCPVVVSARCDALSLVPWCRAAAWCRGVLSCRLVGFVSCVGVVVPT